MALPEDFEGARSLLEAATDLHALDGRKVYARMLASDGTTIASARGPVRTMVTGTPPRTFQLSFGGSGRPPEIQRAEYLAGRRFPLTTAELVLSAAGFQEAWLETIDGVDLFTLRVTTTQFRLEVTDP